MDGWEGPFEMIPIEGGKSEWFIVPEDAATVVLMQNNLEIARKAIQVRPGEMTVVQL
jgi:hypothetical protein